MFNLTHAFLIREPGRNNPEFTVQSFALKFVVWLVWLCSLRLARDRLGWIFFPFEDDEPFPF